MTSKAIEARKLFMSHASLPEPCLVLLEAFHFKYHPAWQCFLSCLKPENVERVESISFMPVGFSGRGIWIFGGVYELWVEV